MGSVPGTLRLRFRIEVPGQVVAVDMTHAGTTYRLLAGRGLLVHFAEEVRL